MAAPRPEHAHASARPASATPTPRPPHPRQQDDGKIDVLSSANGPSTVELQQRCDGQQRRDFPTQTCPALLVRDNNYVPVRNIMPTDKMSVPFTEAQPHLLHFDPKLLLHLHGCLVIVKYPKDHQCVTDTSNSTQGVCGIFLGCHATLALEKSGFPARRNHILQGGRDF